MDGTEPNEVQLYQREQLNRLMLAVKQEGASADSSLVGFTLKERTECLTARELATLSLLSRGYTNLAIAQALETSISTVKQYINNMYLKLDGNSGFDNKECLRVSITNLYLKAMEESSRLAILERDLYCAHLN